MATLNASATSKALNYSSDTFLTDVTSGHVASIPVHTATQFTEVLSTGYRYDEFGSFTYSGTRKVDGFVYPDLDTEVITGFSAFYNDALIFSLSGTNVRGTQLQALTASQSAGELWLAGNDNVSLGSGADVFAGFAGNDSIDGGAGIDTAVYFGTKANYTVTKTATGLMVKDNVGNDGTDTLSNIERLLFDDRMVAFDINGDAGEAYRLYQAAFDRRPDNDGLKYWIGILDHGIGLQTIANAFIISKEFQDLYGANTSPEEFIRLLYQNVLDRLPDQNGFDYWMTQFSAGTVTKDSLLVNFSESAENQANVIGAIQNGIDLL